MVGCSNAAKPSRLALISLRERDYEPYYPQIKNGHGPQALFVNYCFVRTKMQWSPACFAPGITRLIGNKGAPPDEVSDDVVDEIRSREDANGYVRLPELRKPRGLKVGDKVRLTGGLFCGQSGLVVGMSNCERVAVLLSTLGKVSMSRKDVERIE